MSNKPAAILAPDTFELWRTSFNTLLAVAPEVIEHGTLGPTVSDDDYESGTLWAKLDTKEIWVLAFSSGLGAGDAVWKQLGSTPGALLNTGAVPLISNWNAGSFTITASKFISTVAIGTTPFTVTSTTVVPNLNVQYLNGKQSTDIVLRNGSQALTADWNVGAFDITNVGGFTSEMITANATASTRLDLGSTIAKFGSSTSATDYSLGRPIDNGTFILNGGSGFGGNVVLYGNAHSTQANDIAFRAAGAVRLQWDDSVLAWDFKSRNVTSMGTLNGRDLSADGTKLDGIAANANNYTHPSHTGDVTGSGALTIASAAVTNAKLANMAYGALKLRKSSGAGVPEDSTIIALPVATSADVLLGQAPSGAFSKMAVSNFLDNTAPALLRNPYKAHLSYGTTASGTRTFDCEQYATGSIDAITTSTAVTISLLFPAFGTGAARGLASGFSLAGKIYVHTTSASTNISVTTNATTNPFGSNGDGAKGIAPYGTNEWAILAYEYFTDSSNSFVWCEWVRDT